jgi:flagellar basal-body rod protein FlgC
MLEILDISATGLNVQRHRMNMIANNISNAETTRAGRDAQGKVIPYRRRTTLLNPRGGIFAKKLKGVYGRYVKDPRPFKEIYRPGHPDADPETGKLKLPNVDVLTEYVDAMNAQRNYEANVRVMSVTKSMINSAIRILA